MEKAFYQTLLERMDAMIHKNRDMSDQVIGYVINQGGPFGFTTYSPCYWFHPSNDIVRCLCEVVGGGTLWLNYRWGDVVRDPEKGRHYYQRLRKIKSTKPCLRQ